MASRQMRTRSMSSLMDRAPTFDLYRARAERNIGRHLMRELVEAFAFFVIATGDIGIDAVGESPEQLVHRKPRYLALDIPQGNVDSAKHAGGNTAPPDQFRSPHLVPNTLVGKRVHSDEHRFEVLHQDLAHFG